jgi:hypothetical protein
LKCPAALRRRRLPSWLVPVPAPTPPASPDLALRLALLRDWSCRRTLQAMRSNVATQPGACAPPLATRGGCWRAPAECGANGVTSGLVTTTSAHCFRRVELDGLFIPESVVVAIAKHVELSLIDIGTFPTDGFSALLRRLCQSCLRWSCGPALGRRGLGYFDISSAKWLRPLGLRDTTSA